MWLKLEIQLFRERLSGKVLATILKDIAGGFEFSFFSKKFVRIGTKGHGNVFASAKGKQQKQVRQLQSSGTVYWSYPILPFGIVACTFSRNSCIQKSAILIKVQILNEVALIQVVRKRVSFQDCKNEKKKISYHQNMILSSIPTLLNNNLRHL